MEDHLEDATAEEGPAAGIGTAAIAGHARAAAIPAASAAAAAVALLPGAAIDDVLICPQFSLPA